VANAHAWGSVALVFGDGSWAATALYLYTHIDGGPGPTYHYYKGKSVTLLCNFYSEITFLRSGVKIGEFNGRNIRHYPGGRVGASLCIYDVLLRKRAGTRARSK
jgi:hypothetical protein